MEVDSDMAQKELMRDGGRRGRSANTTNTANHHAKTDNSATVLN
jgi:hypothetical protein